MSGFLGKGMINLPARVHEWFLLEMFHDRAFFQGKRQGTSLVAPRSLRTSKGVQTQVVPLYLLILGHRFEPGTRIQWVSLQGTDDTVISTAVLAAAYDSTLPG